MVIHISDAILNTEFFALVFIVILLISTHKQPTKEIFPIELTNELKGFAILAILFGHIGYFLTDDNNFLFPLSILSGVGVNLFLFLSGVGLTLSNLKNNYPILSFYKKRLENLFLSLWIVLIACLLLDYCLLHRTYPAQELWQSFVGFFKEANPVYNINSPLWFITFILFYYLIFPLTWAKKLPIVSPFLVFIITFFITHIRIPVSSDNLQLYQIHLLAFPFGMLFAILITQKNITMFLEKFLQKSLLKLLIIIPLLFVFGYTAYYSRVGQGIIPEQLTSLITMSSIILIFMFNNFTFRLLSFVGIFSYEIYLIHWPLLSRYDFLYKNLPPFLATILYLILFLALGFLLQKLDDKISKLIRF